MNGLIQSKKQLEKIEKEKKEQFDADCIYMRLALEQAEIALEKGEIPVGAIIVKNGEIIAVAYNRKEEKNCAIYHAEICAIEQASQKIGWRLDGCVMYVTLEPCAMCSGAIASARIDRLVYGAEEKKSGYAVSRGTLLNDCGLNFSVSVSGGVLKEECLALITRFFSGKR